ncbi:MULTISPECIES: phytanoyl-CoA dioxygenase family protein [Streptomyces]|uniref:phytanoyl-CoA dioxygenase family protein n=1 Tax=Streptomyces TaxID=1883 RepID=UPI002271A0E5|nr:MULTISPECIES: phytanoyl-CoA dioxygenase family protein [unclassified Streptomyces]MCY0940134.1 phytanoyl-CoA dioxygenase family protein [Streptomyces sp. H34-AA3]MCZ4080782.1 phytanoyl-CoA dioxygenase family protein [Streptomyces sp. H34-S5]
MTLKALTADQIDQFNRDGYCIVPSLLSPSDLSYIKDYYARAATAQTSAVPGSTAWDQDENSAPVLRRAPAPFDNDSGFRAIFSSPRVLDHVEDLIGPSIYLHSSKLIFKPARSGRRKPMHQDLAYWTDMSARQVTLWCAIDPATPERGGIEILPGSHRRLLPHEDLDDYQVREEELDLSQVRPAIMQPGDALFLDVMTVHASAQNRSDHDRLAAVVNYYSQPKSATQTSRYGSTLPLRAPHHQLS